MIIVMGIDASIAQISEVVTRVKGLGYDAHISEGEDRTIIGVVGSGPTIDREQLAMMAGVKEVIRVSKPYKLASLEFHPEKTLVPLNGVQVGSEKLALIAGPCSVESRSQILETAHAVKEAGATALRGGAFKPRTSPFAFQGLGEEGLKLLAEAREATGLPIVTEVMDSELVPMVCEYADMLQIGARNMQNYALLNAVGKSQHPVLLKRGMSSTIEELLMAADYILSHHNSRVILCERGIRTFETATRNTFDINAIPVLKQTTHLPVLADPSHATGKWEYVEAASLAAIAAGADGLIVEVHHDPECAVSDGRQSLKPERFAELVKKARRVAEAIDRIL
ncbi:MAG: 3-deoxy-7-phosphoheptulonate synthase [Anaerolineae bacterium]|nr:MAG: 3-deoxy-7-phosphoheptulonate synthase [Anaerolineae bacterium]MCL4879821.1 3-deoxy-7-phosphoheptulonate synthase [Anaerolineae bacterium]